MMRKLKEHLAIQVQGAFEADARRTVQLRDHDALRAIDHEGTLRGHERNFTHVDFSSFVPCSSLSRKGHVQRSAEGLPFAHRFADAQLRFADLVAGKIQRDLFVIAGDGENSLKTACRPVILRLDSGTSVWRNSMYESSWISMRLGGSAPSRSLPKYLRSDMEIARWTGFCWVAFAPLPESGERVEMIGYGAVQTRGRQKAEAQKRRGRHASSAFRCLC